PIHRTVEPAEIDPAPRNRRCRAPAVAGMGFPERPVEAPGLQIQTDQFVPQGYAVDSLAETENVCRHAAAQSHTSRGLIFPSHFPRCPIESINVARGAAIGSDENQVIRDKRVTVETVLAAILADIVRPAHLPGPRFETIKGTCA